MDLYSYRIKLFCSKIINDNDISILISSSPPLIVFRLAYKLKKQFKEKILWITDLRDLSSLHPTIREKTLILRKRQEKDEIKNINASDICLIVSLGMLKAIKSLLTDYALDYNNNKFYIIENGYADVDIVKPQTEIELFIKTAKKNNKIVIIYAGTGILNDFNKHTERSKTLNCFVDLLVTDPYLSNKYALIIQGVVKNAGKYFQSAKTDLSYLVLHSVNNKQIRANLALADIWVNVNVDIEYSPQLIGGKVYDYCVSELALILIFPENPYSLKVFAQQNVNKPYFADVFDPESIRKVLMDIADNPEEMNKRRFTKEEMEPHRRENQYKKILEILGN
jgi:hypothetical protein